MTDEIEITPPSEPTLSTVAPSTDANAPQPPAPWTPPVTVEHKFSFTGNGAEYFKIWIVNIMLTVVTLGFYSPWAKVRRNRYFYSNTHLADGSFDYHGNPIAILKGRIVAGVLFVLYNLAFKTLSIYTLIMLIVMATVLPWLIWKSFQFKLYNSSYRGVRFGFKGTAKQAYFHFLALPVFTLFSAYVLMPFTHHRIKRFQHTESHFGGTHFSFKAKVENFYINYLIYIGLSVAAVVVGLILMSVLGGAGTLLLGDKLNQSTKAAATAGLIGIGVFIIYASLLMIYPVFMAMMQNLIWNGTQLGDHKFKSNLKWTKMLFIVVTNVLGVIFTLGFYAPFAHIRYTKYRMESLTLISQGSLDNFVTDTEQRVSATGEGMVDFMDFDFSF